MNEVSKMETKLAVMMKETNEWEHQILILQNAKMNDT